jgi:histidine triad (HIT) family protein
MRSHGKVMTWLSGLLLLGLGVVIGGYLFSQSQPRSFLSVTHCRKCLSRADLLGLIASVGIRKFPELLPEVVFETDKTVVIKDPFDEEPFHYVIIPKKDIKNIGEISSTDLPYLIDVFAVTDWLVKKERLVKYRFYTNGPGYQDVTYLHFHLVAAE